VRVKKSIAGMYYIGVFGRTMCWYVITPVVNRFNAKNPSLVESVITLLPATPMKMNLLYNASHSQFFEYKNEVFANSTDVFIEFQLEPLVGKFSMLINDINVTNGTYRVYANSKNFKKTFKIQVLAIP